MSNLTVANTILEQLGGRKFSALTGAKLFVGDEKSLSFKLPSRFARNDINHVEVTLDPSDTYTIIFRVLRGLKIREIARHEGVYHDELQKFFVLETGLDTTF